MIRYVPKGQSIGATWLAILWLQASPTDSPSCHIAIATTATIVTFVSNIVTIATIIVTNITIIIISVATVLTSTTITTTYNAFVIIIIILTQSTSSRFLLDRFAFGCVCVFICVRVRGLSAALAVGWDL